MSTHRVTLVTTTGAVHSLASTMGDAYTLQGEIETSVSQGRTAGIQTDIGYQQFNILHIVRWWVEEVADVR